MKTILKILLLVWILAACAPGPMEQPLISRDDSGQNPSYPNPSYPNPSYPNDGSSVINDRPLSPAEEAVVKQLTGNLGLKVNDISVVSNVNMEFSDACMGVAMPELMCAQVVTPGYIIVLEADGVQYEYHTNSDGSRIQPATLALIWRREGGIAGFCDNLTVFLSGEVYGNQCKTQDGRMGTFASLLTSADREQFASWVAEYDQVNIDVSDPKGVSDRMVVTLTFTGQGDQKTILETNQQELLTFAQSLYQELYK